MLTTSLIFAISLFQAPPSAQKPIRFPLPCDRSLPTENTLFVLESPPLKVLKKEGGTFFPYQFIKEKLLTTILSLGRSNLTHWDSLDPLLIKELEGMDRGFSLSVFSFPQKRGKTTFFHEEGALLLGQTSNRSWAEGQWGRLNQHFTEKDKTELQEKTLGGSPLVGRFLHSLYRKGGPNRLGILGHGRRGSIMGLHVNTFFAWSEKAATERQKNAMEGAQFNLGAGLGALGLKHGGAKVKGLKVYRPKGTILGRLVAHLGPYFQHTEERWKKWGRGETPPQLLGFFSIQAVQDTLWTHAGKLFEKIEILEREDVRSIFAVLAPLAPPRAPIPESLPAKAVGYLRVSFHLPWIKELFERIQASNNYAISQPNMAMALNTIRAILGMPIPKTNPSKMSDMVGTREITILLALPSPGSLWPEIFILSPKGKSPLSQEARLSALSKPFLKTILRGRDLPEEQIIQSKIKHLGKDQSRVSYLNFFKLVNNDGTRGSSLIMRSFLPGGGKFSTGSNDQFEILSFSPAVLRNYLRGKRTPPSTVSDWCPSPSPQGKGDLLQAGFNLRPLVKVYPFQVVLLGFQATRVSSRNARKAEKPKIPNFKRMGEWMTPETIRMRRLPAKEGKRGMLVINHEGVSILSPYSILGLSYAGNFLSDLAFGF